MTLIDSLDNFSKFVFQLLAVPLIVLCVSVSVWALNTAQSSKLTDAGRSESSEAQIFASRSQVEALLATEQKIATLSTQLEFMVWPEERQQIGAELIRHLRAKLNKNPFNGDAWRQLSYAEKAAQLGSQNRIWTIERAAVLVGWDQRELFLLSHHCFVRYEAFKRVSPDFCDNFLSALLKGPSGPSNLNVLAVSVGVDANRARRVLTEAGIAIPGSP